MIVIYAGTITMDPAVRDEFIAARLEQMRQNRTHHGVIGYAITPDPLDAGVVNVFECYESEEALAEHQARHVRNLDIPVLSYNLYRYDATRTPLIVG